MERELGFDGGRPRRRPRGAAARGRRPTADGELVEEVLRTALALESVISSLLEELPAGAFPGRDDPPSS